MKKVIALALALLMIVALVGCGKGRREPIQLTLSTEDSAAILAAAGIHLPPAEEAKGANSEVKWFCWYDEFQNYDEDEIVSTGYFTFTDFYGGHIKYMETTYEDFTTELAQLILGGDPPDITPTGISQIMVFPMPCMKGTYQAIDNWIDYDDPLWADMKDASEFFALGDKHYAIIYDLTFKDVCPYNKRVIEDYGFEDPYELYQNDEWTWDVVYEMASEFSDGDSDRYAFDGWYVPMCIAEESTGRYLIGKDEMGYYSNIDDPVIERAEDMIYEMVKNDYFYHEGNDYWANRNEAQYGAGVKDGLCLFWMCDISGFRLPVDEVQSIWGDIANDEFMFVPLPRHADGDGNYYLSANPTGYMLVNDAPNPDGAVLLAMCMRFKIVDPTVIQIDEKQLREIYMWNDDLLDMYDHCNELVIENTRLFNTGAIPDNLRSAYDHLDWDIRRGGAASTWAQLKEKYRDQMDYFCQQLNDEIDQFIATGVPVEE